MEFEFLNLIEERLRNLEEENLDLLDDEEDDFFEILHDTDDEGYKSDEEIEIEDLPEGW